MKESSEKRYNFDKSRIDHLESDIGITYEVFFPDNPKDRLPYDNGFCRFTPVGYLRTKGGWFPLGYKVVTTELKSLGLRKNPTIMEFPVGEWIFETNKIQCGDKDWGGIWSALRKGSIKTLKQHCQDTWDMETRGFLVAIWNPVFANSYRIKSQGVMLLNEIT